MLTGPLSRAARALVQLTRERIAARSGLAVEAIEAFERGLGDLGEDEKARLASALEAAGAVFIPENGGGAGVRLKFTRSETRRIATLEGEGGVVADDEVP